MEIKQSLETERRNTLALQQQEAKKAALVEELRAQVDNLTKQK